ncbi:hypothetical protein GUITHDRAFT_99756 [Guillardia theta CCMP2712]|uniref:3-hydroxyisobutyryl-CoA hydrolase n=1 Tax=Guillardia theta (strain CCMP2712) TaxID=905079 RepID=L1K1Q9_GUITC|nr:hypothetical protein GUITHDRAFT_99756 [Guillardia theta CCMP2712]EKX54278.1 hypothetical protein GUITHDRAFT_99756 [Guillardia theta CCMP2712]|eukprot:XP_005841258.1 hypothetical protein GUITHDRAFT_99756 [Guillardia theta CCMP2712]
MTNPFSMPRKRLSSKLGVDTGRKTRSFEEQLKKLKAQQDQSSSAHNEESAAPTVAGHGTKTLAQRLSQSLKDPLRSKDFLGQVDKDCYHNCKVFSFKNRRGTLSEEALRSLKDIIQLSDCNWYEKFTIFKGGEESFCMGLDVRALAMNRDNRPHELDPQHVQYQLGWIIAKSSKKRLALMDGHCIGAGAALALAHTSQHAHFLGMSPGNGCSFYLPRLKGHIGLYLALTGARINGADALYAGAASHFVPRNRLDKCLKALINSPADVSSEQVDAIVADHSASFESTKELTCLPKTFDSPPSYYARCFGQQSVAEILEALQQERTPWAQSTLERLQLMSPTALHVTFELFRRGASCELEECLRTEWRLVHRKWQDFKEGVRAFETDKDGKPSWQPQPSQEEVLAMFKPMNEAVCPPLDLSLDHLNKNNKQVLSKVGQMRV